MTFPFQTTIVNRLKHIIRIKEAYFVRILDSYKIKKPKTFDKWEVGNRLFVQSRVRRNFRRRWFRRKIRKWRFFPKRFYESDYLNRKERRLRSLLTPKGIAWVTPHEKYERYHQIRGEKRWLYRRPRFRTRRIYGKTWNFKEYLPRRKKVRRMLRRQFRKPFRIEQREFFNSPKNLFVDSAKVVYEINRLNTILKKPSLKKFTYLFKFNKIYRRRAQRPFLFSAIKGLYGRMLFSRKILGSNNDNNELNSKESKLVENSKKLLLLFRNRLSLWRYWNSFRGYKKSKYPFLYRRLNFLQKKKLRFYQKLSTLLFWGSASFFKPVDFRYFNFRRKPRLGKKLYRRRKLLIPSVGKRLGVMDELQAKFPTVELKKTRSNMFLTLKKDNRIVYMISSGYIKENQGPNRATPFCIERFAKHFALYLLKNKYRRFNLILKSKMNYLVKSAIKSLFTTSMIHPKIGKKFSPKIMMGQTLAVKAHNGLRKKRPRRM